MTILLIILGDILFCVLLAVYLLWGVVLIAGRSDTAAVTDGAA